MDINKEKTIKKIDPSDEYYSEISELCKDLEKVEFYPVFEENSWCCTCGCENGASNTVCAKCSASADKLRLVFSELFLMQKRNENEAKRRVAEKRRMEEEAERWRRIDPEVENIYTEAQRFEQTRDNYLAAAEKLESIKGYKDSESLAKEYRVLAESAPLYDKKTLRERRIRLVKNIAAVTSVALAAIFVIYVILYFTVIAPRGMRYEIENGEVTITSYDMFFGGKHARIPEKMFGKPVTAIGDHAFERSTALVSIEIPEGVETIGQSAFAGCKKLKTVVIPESVTEIGSSAFSGCSSLKKAEIRGKIEVLTISAFFDCEQLAELIIRHPIKNIETLVFSGCIRLRDIRFGGSEQEWSKIAISNGNDVLETVAVTFNYEK